VPLALVALVQETVAAGKLAPAFAGPPPSAGLTKQAAVIIAEVSPGLPPDALARIAVAWSQLFGMISFEVFGQFTGSFDPTDEFFAYATEQLADFVGVRD
jgi:hypothetical protein